MPNTEHVTKILIDMGIALLSFIIGWIVITVFIKVLRKLLEKSKIDKSLHAFITNGIRVVFLIILAIIILQELGLNTSSLLTVLGAGGAAIALALKDSLGNVAGGFLILINKPFKCGDVIAVNGSVDATGIVDEMVGGISTIKAFGVEEMALDSFEQADENLRDAYVKATFFSSISNPATRFVNALVYAGVGITGAFLAISGYISVGQLASVLSYAQQYTKPFNDISGVVTELQNSIACAARVFALIDESEIVADPENAVELKNVEGNVKLENVKFSYVPDKKFIDNLNIDVKKGQRVAFVGPTGCGKTTVINLLMRFYEITGGRISVEGISTKEVTRDSLVKSFGMVLQDTWLKSGTIRENIAMGKPDASMEEIVAAAKEAYADGFIRRLPNGYDTVITEGGENFSAGQRQLLCIARVMLCLPPILILDEATSSIDTRTELKIQDAFDKMMQGRTSFIVAHRLSTIRSADVIMVMKDGHIIESGKHEELLEKKGFYANLYNSQFA